MSILFAVLSITLFGLLVFIYIGYRTYSAYMEMLHRRAMSEIQKEIVKRRNPTKLKDKKDDDEYLSREKNTRQAAKNIVRGVEKGVVHDVDLIEKQNIENDLELDIYDPITGKSHSRQQVQNLGGRSPSSMPLAQAAHKKYENAKIIGIAKPIGRWTAFVIKQQTMWIAMRQAISGDAGYWQQMIKAQASGQMFEQSRGKGREL